MFYTRGQRFIRMLAAPQLVLYLTVMLLSMMILSFSTLTKAAMRMEASKTWVMSNFMLEGSPGEGKGEGRRHRASVHRGGEEGKTRHVWVGRTTTIRRPGAGRGKTQLTQNAFQVARDCRKVDREPARVLALRQEVQVVQDRAVENLKLGQRERREEDVERRLQEHQQHILE